MRLREVQVLQSPFGSIQLDHPGAKYDVISAKAPLSRVTAEPVVEKLRILMLSASPEGDLRITREHTRIRKAVEAALHRDLVEFEVRLSATAADLQEGIAKFRPHVVHFAGHGADKLIQLERDLDERHEGVVITERALAAACAATTMLMDSIAPSMPDRTRHICRLQRPVIGYFQECLYRLGGRRPPLSSRRITGPLQEETTSCLPLRVWYLRSV